MNGKETVVIAKEPTEGNNTVYNLEAAKYHNYFVVMPNGERYLVHNKDAYATEE